MVAAVALEELEARDGAPPLELFVAYGQEDPCSVGIGRW